MKNSKLHPASGIYLALVMLFLYLPIIMLIVLSFNGTNSTSVIQGFSTKWYVELFKDSATINALTNTLILAVTSAITATVIGTLAAVGIDKMKKGVVKSSVMTVTNIPMMNPEIVTGVSMMLLFVFIGSILGASGVLGFWTLFIAHVTFSLPYVILNVLPKLRQTDSNLSQAAQDLGSNNFTVFRKVVAPLSVPGIISGVTMVFVPSASTFLVAQYLGGPDDIMIGDVIEKIFWTDQNTGSAISLILMIFIFVFLIIMNLFGDEEAIA